MDSSNSLSFLILALAIAFASLPAALASSSGYLQLPTDAMNDICYSSPKPASCPVNCFTTDPVCGADGVTYWCGCAEAACAGSRVAKVGFCEVGNGGSGPVSGQALLLVHIVWLIILGFSVLFGFF